MELCTIDTREGDDGEDEAKDEKRGEGLGRASKEYGVGEDVVR